MRTGLTGLLIVHIAILMGGCGEGGDSTATCDDIAPAFFALCEDELDLDLDEFEESAECLTEEWTDCQKVVECLDEQETCDKETLSCLYGYDYCNPFDCPVAEVDCYDSVFSDGGIGFDLREAFGRCISAHSKYGQETDHKYTAIQICKEGKCVPPKDVIQILCDER
jgi:hypothetical protein